jgi:hypothetical protein
MKSLRIRIATVVAGLAALLLAGGASFLRIN